MGAIKVSGLMRKNEFIGYLFLIDETLLIKE